MNVRMKLVVNTVAQQGGDGGVGAEEITMSPVTSSVEGSANKTWSQYTPCGQIRFTVTNKELFGRFKPGQFFFADLSETTKEAL